MGLSTPQSSVFRVDFYTPLTVVFNFSWNLLMNTQTSLLGLLTLTLLTGCQTSHLVVGNERAPTSPEEVVLYTSPPNAPYENVALISTGSAFSWSLSEQSKLNVVIRRLKEDAAKLGANGLIVTWLGDEYLGTLQSGSFNATATDQGLYQTRVQGNTSSTSVPVFVKKGEATAIYIAPEDK